MSGYATYESVHVLLSKSAFLMAHFWGLTEIHEYTGGL